MKSMVWKQVQKRREDRCWGTESIATTAHNGEAQEKLVSELETREGRQMLV